MKAMIKKGFVFTVAAMFLMSASWSQEKASPSATATGKVNDANISINYSGAAVIN